MGLKEIIDREFAPPNRESTMNLLRATGLFVGAILFMRNFGEQMAI